MLVDALLPPGGDGVGIAAVALGFPVQGAQGVHEHGAAADFVDALVELVVDLPEMIVVSFFKIEVLQFAELPQTLGIGLGAVFGGVEGGQALAAQADVHDVLQVLQRDAQHHAALAGIPDQPLLLQAAQGLPDGGAAHVQLLHQLQFGEHLPPGVHPGDNIGLQLLKYLIRQRDGF